MPAGIAALRFGSRAVSVAGLLVMGVAGIASALSPSVTALAATRFLAGVGAAFFFSPGLSFLARYYPAGQRGPIIGWYNGAFSIGAGLGIFGGAVAGAAFGWPFALGLGGVLLLPMAVLVLVAAPPDPPGELARRPGELWARSLRVFRSRSLWALAFALTGFWGAVFVVAQDMVQFAHDARPEWGVGVAAAIAAAVVLVSVPGGPVGGWLAERSRDPRWVAALFGALTGLMVLAVPFAPLPVMVTAMLALGFFDGLVFTVIYLIPTYLAEGRGEAMALAVALLNSVQVLVGSALAVLFGFLAAGPGYTVAWAAMALLTVVPLPLLLLVERQELPPRGVRTPPVRAPAPPA